MFLIDNSSSNAATDCQNPKKTGALNGTDLYECQRETNREIAVKAVHDLLAGIAAAEPDNAMAKSTLAIGSFPTIADYVSGFQIQANWLDVTAATKQQVASAMLFARKPAGLTPYGGAMSAAARSFSAGVPNDERAKVAVLVTDGEPTDANPNAVAAQAAALHAQGIQTITVFYSTSESRAQRAVKHKAMMKGIDDDQLKHGNGHWFNPQTYGDFEGYFRALSGGPGDIGLPLRISAQTVEVKDAAALRETFLKIVQEKVISCQ